MKRFPGMAALILMTVLAGLAAGCAAQKYPDGVYAEVMTNRGLIVLRLEFEKTPMTVANFVGLAEGTIKNSAAPLGTPYFDGTTWHRVAPGHVIQTGIARDAKDTGPGYKFPNEIRPDLNHDQAGMVNMANSGPHTNGSQWCIMLGNRSYLDGDYTVFGRVHQGMNVVFSIVQGGEIQTVKIVRVGKTAKNFRPTTESFQQLVDEAKARVQEDDAKRKQAEEETIAKNWPNAVSGENGVNYVVVREGKGKTPAAGARLKLSYTGKTLEGTAFVSTAEAGQPFWGDQPEPFEYIVGSTHVTPGFDAAAARMKAGEKRILIVPGNQGYGIPGFYAKEIKGEKRFHISPNTVLIYEVELVGTMGNPGK